MNSELGDSSFECVHCGYVARNSSQLDIHHRVHTGIRPYKCEQCGVAFTQKNNLTRHMQVHGGRFQYKCSYDTCNFASRGYPVFKQHMMQHGSLPYQCRLCEKGYFFQQCDLQRHISRLHGNLSADEQEELLTSGKRSHAELAQNEALSVCTSSVTVSTKPQQRAVDRGLKRRRQTAPKFSGDLAPCPAVDYAGNDEPLQNYYKTEPAGSEECGEYDVDEEYAELDNFDSVGNDEMDDVTDEGQQDHSCTRLKAKGHADAELKYDPALSEKSVGPTVVKFEAAESTQDTLGSSTPADWYHCQTCDIYFGNVVMYTIHAGAHSRRNPLECNVCGRVSRDCYEFAAHLSYGDHCRIASSRP